MQLRFEAPGVKAQRAFRDTDRLRDVLAWMQVCDDKCLRAHPSLQFCRGSASTSRTSAAHKQKSSRSASSASPLVPAHRQEEEEEEEEVAKDGGGASR